jgi:transcriptional regulator with XRE-family HTH domain
VFNQFGRALKQLREDQGLLQRELASLLEMDTPLLSKIERGERVSKKEFVIRIAEVLKADKNQLLTLWLADQIFAIIKHEEVAQDAIHIVFEELKIMTKLK